MKRPTTDRTHVVYVNNSKKRVSSAEYHGARGPTVCGVYLGDRRPKK